MSDDYHKLAKDAGNRLRAYILSFSSGSAGVFFFSLTGKDTTHLTWLERTSLGIGFLFFVATVVLCLYELHIDARRFFNIAKQLEMPEEQRSWVQNEIYKKKRVKLMYGSYITTLIGVFATIIYIVLRLT